MSYSFNYRDLVPARVLDGALEQYLIAGSKGGGKGKGGSSTNDAKNTLRSKARARIVEIISEGPCVGLVDGDKSIYYEQTPVRNADGSENFKNVIWQQRLGTPDQEHLTGFATAEVPYDVNVEVKSATGPVQRTINEQNATAVRVIVNLPTLASQNQKSGAVETASVSYAFDVRGYNGSWQRAVTQNLNNQKTTSAVQRAHRVELPAGGSPWDIRMVRLTPDSDNERLQNGTTWEGYAVLIEGKFTYPNTAIIATEVNAEDMGNSIPARSYRFRGRIISVPSNYDPITRKYTGVWDGTFKQAWTNNPAWIFYDILINDRYGLGEFINPETIDKWTLYQIAQYCDELVKSGFKNGDTGEDIYEPRFTFNGSLQSRSEAYKVLQQITTTWRGMCYWSLGQVFATADMPADPVKLVTPANVIGGEFNYSGTAKKARTSVVLVKYNDPDDFYAPNTEAVINDRQLAKFGWREKTVDLLGATSRGLAHRYGKWISDTEENETETVEYTASWDHADVKPGELIALADPRKAQMRLGGRLASAGADYVILDQPFDRAAGEVYHLMIVLPSGELHKALVETFSDEVIVDGVSMGFKRANLAEVLPMKPDVNAMWIGTGTDIQPRLYRVIAMSEEKKNQFQITALFHDPNKFARVEDGITLEPKTYTRPKAQVAAPTGLKVREVSYVDAGRQYARLTLSWDVKNDYTVRYYEVGAVHPTKGYITLGTTENGFMDLDDAEVGNYTFYVYAIGFSTIRSAPATFEYEYVGFNGLAAPTVTELQLVDNPGGTEFTGRDVLIRWKNNFPATTAVLASGATPSDEVSPFYAGNTLKIFVGATNTLLRQQIVQGSGFSYSYELNKSDSLAAGLDNATRALRIEVTVAATYGKTSAAATLAVNNPTPGLVALKALADGSSIHMDWQNPTETDFGGVKVWVEKNQNFDPLVREPFYEGRNDNVIFPGEEVTAYYVRIGAYDTFGVADMLIGPPILINTERVLDLEPPAVPTGLTLTTAMSVGPDGTLRAVVRATVEPNSEDDLAAYLFQIKEGDGNYTSASSPDPFYEWVVTPGQTYTVKVRASDRYNNPSDYCAPETIVAARDTVAPGLVQNLTAVGLFRSIWVDFDLLPDTDMAYYEVEASKGGLATIYTCAAPAFIHSNLTVGDAWSFRVRGVDTSGNRGLFSLIASATVGAINPGDLPPDALISSFALIDTAFIESAQIVEIDAGKLRAGSVISGSVNVATSAGNVPVSDAGAIVNAGSTVIEPGKIQISGGTTLADWRFGGDSTQINGGAIGANTVEANSMVIGMRGINTDGITFEANSPGVNQISWTTGTVRYIGDDGNVATRAIDAGSADWSAGYLYIIWLKGENTLTTTLDAAIAFGNMAVVLGIYAGGTDLTTNYGKTIIDGDRIKTGTILSTHISTTSLSAVSANLGDIRAGRMRSFDDKFVIDLDNKFISIEV